MEAQKWAAELLLPPSPFHNTWNNTPNPLLSSTTRSSVACDMYQPEQKMLTAHFFKPNYLSLKTAQSKHLPSSRRERDFGLAKPLGGSVLTARASCRSTEPNLSLYQWINNVSNLLQASLTAAREEFKLTLFFFIQNIVHSAGVQARLKDLAIQRDCSIFAW